MPPTVIPTARSFTRKRRLGRARCMETPWMSHAGNEIQKLVPISPPGGARLKPRPRLWLSDLLRCRHVGLASAPPPETGGSLVGCRHPFVLRLGDQHHRQDDVLADDAWAPGELKE